MNVAVAQLAHVSFSLIAVQFLFYILFLELHGISICCGWKLTTQYSASRKGGVTASQASKHMHAGSLQQRMFVWIVVCHGDDKRLLFWPEHNSEKAIIEHATMKRSSQLVFPAFATNHAKQALDLSNTRSLLIEARFWCNLCLSHRQKISAVDATRD